jgi:hypothetical protein
MKKIALLFTLTLCATTLLAANLSQKYKEWPRTPQAYFMTNAERAQWSAVTSDAEAEAFINDFIARHGGDAFVKEVARNAAQADKYLTIGKTPGSMTARGKMMILLGPTVPTAVSKKKRGGDVRYAPPAGNSANFTPTMDDMHDASNSPGNSTTFLDEYTYTYPASALPAAYGKPLTVKIEVDSGADRDRFTSFGADKEMDKVYEMVAQARLAAAKPATP